MNKKIVGCVLTVIITVLCQCAFAQSLKVEKKPFEFGAIRLQNNEEICFGGAHKWKRIDRDKITALHVSDEPSVFEGTTPHVLIHTDSCIYRINVKSLGEAASIQNMLLQDIAFVAVVQPEGMGLKCRSPERAPDVVYRPICESKIDRVVVVAPFQ